jgi:superfamily II DNA helicase RecQ
LRSGAAESRVLVVRETGWGKSFVYFIATKLQFVRSPHAQFNPSLVVIDEACP